MELSRLPHVERVAIQTNLSHRVDWTAGADLSRLALWGTYHPSQVPYERFLGRCLDLAGRGVRYSVGAWGSPSTWTPRASCAPTSPPTFTCG
ncbi:hypothetical protein QOZ89_26765 [Pseudofrankia sp. BMG5.37]|nr:MULTISPECIES: hypothetical protein [unclassified Pseudofrankia]MDT3443167.1 hypothetical protein [Pseudofrankia sp. BMG5.37]